MINKILKQAGRVAVELLIALATGCVVCILVFLITYIACLILKLEMTDILYFSQTIQMIVAVIFMALSCLKLMKREKYFKNPDPIEIEKVNEEKKNTFLGKRFYAVHHGIIFFFTAIGVLATMTIIELIIAF